MEFSGVHKDTDELGSLVSPFEVQRAKNYMWMVRLPFIH